MMIQAVANNIVSRCILGRKAEDENGPGKFGELSRRLLVLLTAFSFGDVFPCLAWLDVVTGLFGRINATFKAMDSLFDQVIEEHRISQSDDVDHDQSADRKVFVHILLQLQKDGMLEIDLTQNDMKAILLVESEEDGSIDIVAKLVAIQRDPKLWDRPEEFIPESIVSRCVLGRKAEEENGPGKFGELSRRAMVLMTTFCFGDVFPCLRWLDDVTGLIGHINATFKAMDALFDRVIEEHRISHSDDVDHSSDKKDFVHILLQLQKDGMLEMDLTQNDIKAILLQTTQPSPAEDDGDGDVKWRRRQRRQMCSDDGDDTATAMPDLQRRRRREREGFTETLLFASPSLCRRRRSCTSIAVVASRCHQSWISDLTIVFCWTGLGDLLSWMDELGD
ncbi:hypothetical protein LWI29_002238 [Acer saccharum]|uniref:Uncharacterized protein n=1 Tax=Acer saccharum TaxID=4024 RepID=A0AA39S628_ACESA|nr:hypothetical protein LWI29_002238 [Acer saccharum]